MAARDDSRNRRNGPPMLLAAFALVAAPLALQGQGTDDRWLPWLGCWQPVTGESTTAASRDAGELSNAMVCFQPLAGDAGVEMVTVEEGRIASRRTLRADGERRELELEGCAGWERGEFSARHGRVYLTSEQLCDGGVTRVSSGLLAMTSTGSWVDVRAVTAEGGSSTWVSSYRLASLEDAAAVGLGDIAAGRELAVRSARVAAAARPTMDDVIEASERVPAEGVSAWIAESGMPLDLDADALVRLADAGVPEEVIDMAIAVSYPERFAVARDPEEREVGYGGRYGSYSYRDPFFGASLFYSPFYSPFYSRYGSPYYGRFGYGFGRGGIYVPVVIDRGSRDSGARVISGQGYRRGQATRPASGPSGRSATPRATTTRSSGASVGSSRGSSSSGGSRTARRRGGGGGD